MTRHPDYTTTDIELAAAIMTDANKKPSKITLGRELVEFTFPANETTTSITMKYAAGSLMQEVRRLAANRSWLYRQIREVAQTGRGVNP